ncbi:Gfo/Idh/MocA family oxidoreductase [Paludisphaera mucosa]|uniref:Gfo/Idh/MocA family oxidoreductase n=1 Tax=Paludisphaera mucosa TaxID=3030827 RepID=A0ABT6F637_9BACT|nr:Gfo/Idh/MocA family oxidoreductase [Paludisphaera mucosa]MDG3003053.1 Gfo/Idh/MocA family oxidoreductase [Paludisphaera mucosa]
MNTVVVGYGMAGRELHSPLIQRQPALRLYGVVARKPEVRERAEAERGVKTFSGLDEALDDPAVGLLVLATPHDVHAEMTVKTLDAGRHCVVDKVMALTSADADRMIAARDRSGRMLSVFHNRRWDWDFATIRRILDEGTIGRPLLFESAVCRFKAPQGWRGELGASGTILHDWGAHMVDHALQLGLGPCRRLTSWLFESPWDGVDIGGHGRIILEFDGAIFQAETSRICRIDRPRWWVVGTEGGYVKFGVDPQEDALRGGDIDRADESESQQGLLSTAADPDPATRDPKTIRRRLPSVRSHWDGFYANIAAHLTRDEPLAVTAEQGREVVRVLEAALESSRERTSVEGPWGS